MACFVFGGIDYGERLDVETIEAPAIAKSSPDMRYAAGRDGGYLAGNRLDPMEIKVKARLATDRIDEREIQRMWADVAATMRHDGPVPLSLVDGFYWMAVLADEPKLKFRHYSATAELVFLCPDPVAYGAVRRLTVPSGGEVRFKVDGTYPAKPRIVASAVRDAESLVWGLRLDDGDHVHVATGSAQARSVALDCDARTCTVNGATALPTLDSDWLAFAPGEHTLEMDHGTGAAELVFTERWL